MPAACDGRDRAERELRVLVRQIVLGGQADVLRAEDLPNLGQVEPLGCRHDRPDEVVVGPEHQRLRDLGGVEPEGVGLGGRALRVPMRDQLVRHLGPVKVVGQGLRCSACRHDPSDLYLRER